MNRVSENKKKGWLKIMTHLIILTQYSLVDKFLVLFTPQDPLREREREKKAAMRL